jgi:hypothetical protein
MQSVLISLLSISGSQLCGRNKSGMYERVVG